jgi:branched-chain amino acid transport system permease protein
MKLGDVSTVIVMGSTIGCIYALIAVGLNLIYGTMRMLNVAHGGVIMLGAYTAYWLFTLYEINPLLSAIIAALGGAVVGLIVYKVLFSSAIRTTKSLEDLEGPSLLIFFGFLIFIENVALLSWGGDFRKYAALTDVVVVLGNPVALNRLLSGVVAVAICLLFYIFLQKTLFGKAIRAVIQDKDATRLAGVNTENIYRFCFSVSFAMSALSGALISMFYPVTPFIGFPYTMLAFIVIILGGLGNFLGSLVAGLLLGIVITAVVSYTTPGFAFIVQYLILIFVILLMPQGLFGRRTR